MPRFDSATVRHILNTMSRYPVLRVVTDIQGHPLRYEGGDSLTQTAHIDRPDGILLGSAQYRF